MKTPYPEGTIVHDNDTLGREQIEIDGYQCTSVKRIDFFEWLRDSFKRSIDEFLRLPLKDRRKIFLRWKWGSLSEDANEDCEITRRGTIGMFKDGFPVAKAGNWYYSQIKQDEKDCYEIQERIGIVVEKDRFNKVDEEVNKVAREFGGRVVG